MSASAGHAHTIFLSDSGHLFGCGMNNRGQVGSLPLRGDETKKSKIDKSSVIFPYPVIVVDNSSSGGRKSELSVEEAVEYVSCGDFHTIAISKVGHIYCWGLGYTDRVMPLNEVSEILQLTPSKSIASDPKDVVESIPADKLCIHRFDNRFTSVKATGGSNVTILNFSMNM